MVKTPTILLRAELALSALAALSALVVGFMAMNQDRFFSLGAEALVLVAGVFGVLAGLGRFAHGPALAAACVGGSFAVAAGVSGIESGVIPSLQGERIDLAIVGSRVALAALLGAISGLMILSRRPGRSVKLLLIGIIMGSPIVAVAAAWRAGLVARFEEAVPTVAFQISVLAAGLVGVVLLSISIHCLIRAFEIGVDAADPAESEKVGPVEEAAGA
jgi:hypothetical protein